MSDLHIVACEIWHEEFLGGRLGFGDSRVRDDDRRGRRTGRQRLEMDQPDAAATNHADIDL